MGDYEITGNEMHDRESALDYVMRVFEKWQKKEAIESLDAEIFEKNKSGKIKLKRDNTFNIIEDVRDKSFTAYCYCSPLYANDAERKEFEFSEFNRHIDDNSRDVESWPEWKRSTRIS